jgi:ABC-2 type transport system ATP-binding protein
MHTVDIQGLVKTFGDVRALRGLTAQFPQGTVGLLGPNGAGKSTLLKILLGLLPADSGTTRVLDINTRDDPMEVRRCVGYMPEVDAYMPGLTGADSVLFAGILCGMSRRESRQRAHEILYYVGLGEARYRKVQQYSTGMRQRLRMAQALVHDPELIFLDEPTNGLDPAGREEVLALIDDLASNHKKSVVLCSHLLHDVEAVCHHVVVMRNGEIALNGPIEEVRKLESGVWRMRVHGDFDRFALALEDAGITVVQREGETFRVRLPAGAGPTEVCAVALDGNCVVRELSTSHQSLTDVFVEAVEAKGSA